MTVSPEVVEQVRRRADYACEYCGVTETDAGGALTVDHFRPQNHGGSDDLENLVYCCFRCNVYKAAYWPPGPDEPMLWNPRRERQDAHLLLLMDGKLHAVSATGACTLARLHLNRPHLVAYRLRKHELSEAAKILRENRQESTLVTEMVRRHEVLMREHWNLLKEMRKLLRRRLKRKR